MRCRAGSAKLGGEAKVGASWREDCGEPLENPEENGKTLGKPGESPGKMAIYANFREFMGLMVDIR